MSKDINAIVKRIGPINNRYRDPSVSMRLKLEALWELGDQLIKMGVSKPHSVGWAIQNETRGLIKRPTIFRSHKIRTIWESKNDLLRDLGRLENLSNLTEILPLIDPAQAVRKQLPPKRLAEIYERACRDSPTKFKQYIRQVKKTFSHGKLGKPLDRSKHLGQLNEIVANFNSLLTYLAKLLEGPHRKERERFRSYNSPDELRAFSNMCIALTTKENYRLFKRLGPSISTSLDERLQKAYNDFHSILDRVSDVERARIRRLISPEALATMSDVVSSLSNEAAVDDFRARQKLTINL